MSRLFRPMVPVLEMLGDENMNDGMLRVLLALFQFADKDGNCHPTSEQLARIVRMHPVSVRKATAALLRAGWIEKTGKGGRGAAASYRINSHPYRSATATESDAYRSATATEKEQTKCSATATTTVAGTATVSAPPIVKVHTNNIPVPAPDKLEREARATRAPAQEPAFDLQSEPQRKARKGSAPAERPDDVTEETWEDWCALRRRKRAPINAGVVKKAREEAKKAGMSLEEFLKEWVYRGSQGLYADWIKRTAPQQSGVQYKSAYERKCEAMHQWAHIDEILDEPEKQDNVIDVSARPANREQFQLLEQK